MPLPLSQYVREIARSCDRRAFIVVEFIAVALAINTSQTRQMLPILFAVSVGRYIAHSSVSNSD